MRNRYYVLFLLALVALWNMPPGSAQVIPPPMSGGPPMMNPGAGYSPYMNLLRPGNTAVNYMSGVVPQEAYNASIGGLSQQLGAVGAEASANSQAMNAPLQTGHQAMFMNYSHYYALGGMGRGRMGMGGMGMGGYGMGGMGMGGYGMGGMGMGGMGMGGMGMGGDGMGGMGMGGTGMSGMGMSGMGMGGMGMGGMGMGGMGMKGMGFNGGYGI